MEQEQQLGNEEWQALLNRVVEERRTDNEVREALLGVLARVIDEYRFGLRDCSIDDLRALVHAWMDLNDGETPAEAVLRFAKRS